MFYGKFADEGLIDWLVFNDNFSNISAISWRADEGDIPVNYPKIYNVEGDNRWSPDLHPPTTESMLKMQVYFSPVS